MSDDAMIRQAEKLIGGWVAGTLTPAERATLLEASLGNQALFDALADEEGMRELLADPEVRRGLAAILAAKGAEKKESWWQRLFRPAPMAAFSAGVLAVVGFVVIRPEVQEQRKPAPAMVIETPAASASQATAKDTAMPPPPAAQRERRAGNNTLQPKPMLMARKELAEAESLKDKKAAEPAPPPAAAPSLARNDQPKAEPVPVTPAAPAQIAAESLGEAKRAASAAPPPPPPIRYRVQRLQQPGGEWVEFGGELTPGTQARVAIETTQSGVLTLRLGRDVLSVAVEPGQTVHFPGSGSLPAEAGEREVAVLFQPGLPGSLATPLQSVGGFRAKAATGQRQQSSIGALGGAGPSTEYSVTVRLRYR